MSDRRNEITDWRLLDDQYNEGYILTDDPDFKPTPMYGDSPVITLPYEPNNEQEVMLQDFMSICYARLMGHCTAVAEGEQEALELLIKVAELTELDAEMITLMKAHVIDG